jgi:hypothetical protein
MYHEEFGLGIQVNSAVRPIDYQRSLQAWNGNAAATTGRRASSHLTGSTVDIAKKGLPKRNVAWLRRELVRLERAGLVEATEEMSEVSGLNFHVMVSRAYSDHEWYVERSLKAIK